MKKTMRKDALAKEAAFWATKKLLNEQNPGTVCRK